MTQLRLEPAAPWTRVKHSTTEQLPSRTDNENTSKTNITLLSLSYTVPFPAMIHHNSSRFEPDGKIGVHQDGKKENPASIRCLTILLRCLHDSSTDPLRFMMAALR